MYKYIYIYIYGGWSKHNCRCVIRNDLAPALALPCALQGFYCVPLHRLKYGLKNWLPQKVAQFKRKIYWFPKRPSRTEKQLYGNQISRGMVDAVCIRIENVIPKTALLSQKAAFRESNFKRYGRPRMYTHRKFDSQNSPFEPERSFPGIKFQEAW